MKERSIDEEKGIEEGNSTYILTKVGVLKPIEGFKLLKIRQPAKEPARRGTTNSGGLVPD
jgi:hypothetical protein